MNAEGFGIPWIIPRKLAADPWKAFMDALEQFSSTWRAFAPSEQLKEDFLTAWLVEKLLLNGIRVMMFKAKVEKRVGADFAFAIEDSRFLVQAKRSSTMGSLSKKNKDQMANLMVFCRKNPLWIPLYLKFHESDEKGIQRNFNRFDLVFYFPTESEDKWTSCLRIPIKGEGLRYDHTSKCIACGNPICCKERFEDSDVRTHFPDLVLRCQTFCDGDEDDIDLEMETSMKHDNCPIEYLANLDVVVCCTLRSGVQTLYFKSCNLNHVCRTYLK